MFVPVPMADFATPLVNAAATAASVYENLLVASSPFCSMVPSVRPEQNQSVGQSVNQTDKLKQYARTLCQSCLPTLAGGCIYAGHEETTWVDAGQNFLTELLNF